MLAGTLFVVFLQLVEYQLSSPAPWFDCVQLYDRKTAASPANGLPKSFFNSEETCIKNDIVFGHLRQCAALDLL